MAFTDPKWTPYEVIGIGVSWAGTGIIETNIYPESEQELIEWYLQFHEKATLIVGHNLFGFDLPSLNGAVMRANLPSLTEVLVQDTYSHRMKTRGVRKSMDMTAHWLHLEEEKTHPNWSGRGGAWSHYTPLEERRKIVDPYLRNDVALSEAVFNGMVELGYLHPPRMWRP